MNTKDVFEAKQKLNKFLQENPELKPMQAEIDKMLSGAGTQHNRMVLLHHMMMDKVKELSKAIKTLL